MAPDYLLVAVGGAVGAPLRYLTDRFISTRHQSPFPWGTFMVNIAGSFILGLLAGAALVGADGSAVGMVLGVGLCGALTTYSTFSYETVRLFEQRATLPAVANIAGSVLAGLVAVTAGYGIAAAFTGT
jgi:CrcB protein